VPAVTAIIDLSVALENHATEPYPPTITAYDHASGARRLGTLAGVDSRDFPDGLALATESITASSHSGTHVDAPWHYGPTCEGRPARRIDEIPLEWLYGPGVVLDVRHRSAGEEITAEDVERRLEVLGHELGRGDIALIQTGTDRYWGSHRYTAMQPGLGREATEYLLERGVRTIGIDAWGLDRPASAMAESYHAGQSDALWPAHFLGREREYLQVEKLANLDRLPAPTGFTFAAFPVKVSGASGGWCRAVGIVQEM
jgi:kynurenine formamidase